MIIANNVLAHVPDLNDFVEGFALLLAENGIVTIEFPHLMNLIRHTEFDTIYHEHFSYFSLATAQRVFERHGLSVIDVVELPTHGGSLRVFLQRGSHAPSANVHRVLQAERAAQLDQIETYRGFGEAVNRVKRDLLRCLITARDEGKHVAAYGAAAKGCTLLNYCGIRVDLVDYVADLNPRKQGNLLPGVRIPIVAPDHIREAKPDYVLILPWNIRHEIFAQLDFIKAWGGKFIVPIPQLEIVG